MATRFWIKMYIGMLDEPKTARLPDHLWRRYVELSLLAGREGNDGALPPIEEMAWILRLPEGKVLEDLQSLQDAGVVDCIETGEWVVTNFAKQQAAMPVDERVRQYRERKGGFVTGDVTKRYKRCNEGGEEDSNSTSTYDSESLNGEEEKTAPSTPIGGTCPIFPQTAGDKSKDKNVGGRTEAEATPTALTGTSPILKNKNGGGSTGALAAASPVSPKEGKMGEEGMPRTPMEAMEQPDIGVFAEVTGGRIPGMAQYQAVIEAVRLLRRREKLDEDGLREYLEPFWLAWSTRKRKDGRPYDPGNITWLVEWALNGSIPQAGGAKVAESTRPAVPTPEETRRMLAEKDEILKKAVPMPEEVRAKLHSLAKKMGGKEDP